MATRQVKKTNVKPKTETIEISIESNIAEELVENIATENAVKKVEKTVKKFEPSDGIQCKSITVGGLYMEGLKTHLLYEWADSGDISYVEYQDLLAAVRSNSGYVTRPLFIIEDEDFIAQNPQLNKIYETMYSFNELKDVILKLNPSDMKSTILALPEGAKNSIKHTASQLITNKTLDSVNKITVLDEIFGTEFKLMAGLV